jgi:hypothetical protein
MVRFFLAAFAAFLIFLRAAARCFDEAIILPPLLSQLFANRVQEDVFKWPADIGRPLDA